MSIHTDSVSIPGKAGAFSGYLATPEGGSGPGVVVIQEIFGVNTHIRSICDRLAQAGYVALAPDMYWRLEPDFQSGYDAEDISKGREMKDKTNLDDAIEDVRAAFDALAARPETKGEKMGLTGFCWGGLLTFLAASRLHPACAAAFYGGGIADLLDEAGNINTPTQFHFGDQDTSIPMDDIEKIKSAVQGTPSEVFVYPGAQHGFNCDMRGSYNEASAKQAWARLLQFFEQNLGQG